MVFVPGGDLEEARKKQPLDGVELRFVLKQVLGALDYLHNNSNDTITHWDIKPSNIMVQSRQPMEVKLGDFGLETEGAGYLDPGAGTPFYAAPEVMDLSKNSNTGRVKGKSMDIWSLGLTALKLAAPELPKYPSLPDKPGYDDRSKAHQEWIQKIVSHLKRFPKGKSITMDFILTMLQKSWSDRPSATDCLQNEEYFSAAPNDGGAPR